ncbi:hypothetical protein TNCV_2455881 [Trichonephila clavipes]|nr:hypothetical protein TNCV_2455881 [Trichonephila clavipes]
MQIRELVEAVEEFPHMGMIRVGNSKGFQHIDCCPLTNVEYWSIPWQVAEVVNRHTRQDKSKKQTKKLHRKIQRILPGQNLNAKRVLKSKRWNS